MKLLASLTALAGYLATATAFTATANTNNVVYWGQNSQGTTQETLGFYCAADYVDVVVLSFLNDFGSNGELGLNFANQCGNTFPGSTQLKCDQIAADIKTCQDNGKKVLLSLGGVFGSYGFSSDAEGTAFAQTLWDAFGEGSNDSVLRTFGTSVVDGFDLDIENGSSTGYLALVKQLRTIFAASGSKQYYISTSPQCAFPDASVGDALTNGDVDFAFIQFYNNDCNVNKNFNWNTWADFAASNAANKNLRLFLGLPAGPSAATSGYLDSAALESAIKSIQSSANFGGVSLWDASQAWANVDSDNENYAQLAKKFLLAGEETSTSVQTVTTTSTSSTSTSTSTSGETATSTSSTSTAAATTTSSAAPLSFGADTANLKSGDIALDLEISGSLGPWSSVDVSFAADSHFAFKKVDALLDGSTAAASNTTYFSSTSGREIAGVFSQQIEEGQVLEFRPQGEITEEAAEYVAVAKVLINKRFEKRAEAASTSFESTITITNTNYVAPSSVIKDVASSSSAAAATTASSSAAAAQVTSYAVVSNIATTVLTITSCSDNACSDVPVTTGVTVITTTVGSVETVYTTYCPLTTESEAASSSSSSSKVTSTTPVSSSAVATASSSATGTTVLSAVSGTTTTADVDSTITKKVSSTSTLFPDLSVVSSASNSSSSAVVVSEFEGAAAASAGLNAGVFGTLLVLISVLFI
ncbi:hypothetical protein WICPIJ_002599 [Wickerhamomyces pijperi]|uniref:chitinase n=1 Tax=Wickerhamomyces pijperi TaxID=599730 RepID=A0A9P8TPN5_WICPI|nr:hypothetical protein WICPIJ_002599 [Wickerhamomyces pijperi]